MAFFSNLMQSPAGGKGGGGFLEALRRRIDMDRLLAAQSILQGDPRGAMEIRARRQARDADQVAAKMRSQSEGEPAEERRGPQAMPGPPADFMPALAAAQGVPAGAGHRGAQMRPLAMQESLERPHDRVGSLAARPVAMQVDSSGWPDHRTFMPQDGGSPGRSIGRVFGREAARIAKDVEEGASTTKEKAARTRVPDGYVPSPWQRGGRWGAAEVERRAALGMRMYDIHLARGMDPIEAAAWAANAAAESEGDYRSRQPGGGGYGLFQWESPRRRLFKAHFGHAMEDGTEDEQLKFRDLELLKNERDAAEDIGRPANAGDFAAAITRHYERPRERHIHAIDRANVAEAIVARARARERGVR